MKIVKFRMGLAAVINSLKGKNDEMMKKLDVSRDEISEKDDNEDKNSSEEGQSLENDSISEVPDVVKQTNDNVNAVESIQTNEGFWNSKPAWTEEPTGFNYSEKESGKYGHGSDISDEEAAAYNKASKIGADFVLPVKQDGESDEEFRRRAGVEAALTIGPLGMFKKVKPIMKGVDVAKKAYNAHKISRAGKFGNAVMDTITSGVKAIPKYVHGGAKAVKDFAYGAARVGGETLLNASKHPLLTGVGLGTAGAGIGTGVALGTEGGREFISDTINQAQGGLSSRAQAAEDRKAEIISSHNATKLEQISKLERLLRDGKFDNGKPVSKEQIEQIKAKIRTLRK